MGFRLARPAAARAPRPTCRATRVPSVELQHERAALVDVAREPRTTRSPDARLDRPAPPGQRARAPRGQHRGRVLAARR